MSAKNIVLPPMGIDALRRLEDLPLLRRNTQLVGEDSHDPSGWNNDGFNANFSYLYQDGDEYVLFDEQGPGCVYVIRTIGHKGALKVYLDGASEPVVNLPFKEVYEAQHAAFPRPFVAEEQEAHGSSWCYVPIPFANSCRITTDEMEAPHFYNIFAHKFAPGTPVHAYDPDADLSDISAWMERPDVLPGAPRLKTVSGTARIEPRQWASILEHAGAGAVRSLRMRIARGGNEQAAHLWLRGYWDGHKGVDIDSPAGAFFGLGDARALEALKHPDPGYLTCEHYSCGRVAPRSLFVGESEDGWLYCHFPMPFWSEARLALFNERLDETLEVEFEIGLSETAYPDNAGWFRAQWRSEAPLRLGEDYCVADLRGEGHYVGCVLTLSGVYRAPGAEGHVSRWYLEGDARFYIDGNRTPFVASTGTEEYFNWGWYDEPAHDAPFAYPMHGYPLHIVERDDHNVMYRFHWGEVVPFSRAFRFDLEHGPIGDNESYYSGTAFFYQKSFEPRLVLTDELDVADAQSEQEHAYSCEGELMVERRILPYEGQWQIPKPDDSPRDENGVPDIDAAPKDRPGAVKDDGRVWTGSATFTMRLNPENAGAKLRRRSYYGHGARGEMGSVRERPNLTHPQRVRVTVDGVDVGEWYVPSGHGREAWRDTEFELPEAVTAGKSTIAVALQAVDGTLWDEYSYWMYSYLPV